jgi:protoporphyrinogen oxidase
MPKTAIIIGAGPAGLTAAYELLQRTDTIPIIVEKSGEIGGISRTTNYKGNRMDMGPHRFFSKSDRVMNWWLKIMPLEKNVPANISITYQNKTRDIDASATPNTDTPKTMLVIQRLTRIYFLRKFFSYPIQLSLDTLRTLGIIRTAKIILSFFYIRIFPRKPEKNLEDFIINKFGTTLYHLFFKSYTEKVWGIPPDKISAEWGAQRIKGVSLSKALQEAIKTLRNKKKNKSDISQKQTETSLIEQFLYPKYGPGSLWEEVARQIEEKGGKIYLHQDVREILWEAGKITSVVTVNSQTEQMSTWDGDLFFSTMPVQELISDLGESVPGNVRAVAAGLQYRDFINVGILLRQLSTKDGKKIELKDNWIYIQERDVKVGRLMIYNNWGGGMIKDPDTTWIGMEYFCNKTDDLWAESDEKIQQIAIRELEKMELAKADDVLDSTVRRMEKTYPAYFGTYDQFDTIRSFTDNFYNLFLIGRNGMHKYNNADHSMLTAMVSVDNIVAQIKTKENIWAINTEQEYHEEKATQGETQTSKGKIRNNHLPQPIQQLREYLLHDRLNRIFLWIATLGIITQFVIFKTLYPFAGFINGDSYVYLQSAYFNYDINTYPVGYSKFLRLFSIFSKSDTALVAFQYLAIEVSALLFIFSLFAFYNPGKLAKWILFSFVVFNPVFLYCSNYVSSDSIFLALSILWFTSLLWILKAPTLKLIIFQSAVLLLAFMVRYNALYYPLIATIAFILSSQKLKWKLAGIGSSVLMVIGFMLYTSAQFYHLTGIRQFTPFSGWQLANNAMYAYRYVDSQDVLKAPPRLRALDNMVRHYFDTSRDLSKHPSEMLLASTVYMWDPRSPLQQYMSQHIKKDSTTGVLKQWASMAPLYREYGTYLIRQYPGDYFRYFLLPNALKYYVPPGEFLSQYNMGRDTVAKVAQFWFQYKTQKVRSAFKDLKVNILDFMPILAGTMNVFFLLGGISLVWLGLVTRRSLLLRILVLVCSFWVINFGFSVFASPITLRYQLFAILVFSTFALLWIDSLCRVAFSKPSIGTK